MTVKLKNPDAFLDVGYLEGYPFCQKFLSSPEFTVDFLKSFNVFRRSDLKTKEGYAINIAGAIEQKELDYNDLLIKYVQKPRVWLSLMQGTHSEIPQLKNPRDLLFSFGESGWYGPIRELANSKVWYIYTCRVEHFIPREYGEEGNTKTFDVAYIRWPVIAEVGEKYVALSWDGFSNTSEEKKDSRSQFPFWLHIQGAFKELETILGAKLEHPALEDLLLYKLWDKYDKPQYKWSHKRVRAKSSGIALNAHSGDDDEVDIDDSGLKVLSRTLAEAALDSLNYSFSYDSQQLFQVERAILHTLIREWGTKSYEFRLKKISDAQASIPDTADIDKDVENKVKVETLFRVHCYLGLDLLSNNQDSLQHLKCYQECGSSTGVLKFLLAELNLE
jgi:hypothetical protein